MNNTLWVEKYRPKTVDGLIVPTEIKNILKSFVENNSMTNLFIYGPAGSGKTSVAKALCNELKAEVLFIDASSNNGKAMIESSIVPFASTVSIYNDEAKKVVILDEADGLSVQAQQSFRPIIELYEKTTRFIFTCNFPNKIIEPIKSRCTVLDFGYTGKSEVIDDLKSQMLSRCKAILKHEKIEVSDDNNDILKEFISKKFPDFRSIINELQSYTYNNKLDAGILKQRSVSGDLSKELWNIIKSGNFDVARKYVNESLLSPEDYFINLYNDIDEYIDIEKIPECIISIAEYQYKSAFVSNQNINILALLMSLMNIVN